MSGLLGGGVYGDGGRRIACLQMAKCSAHHDEESPVNLHPHSWMRRVNDNYSEHLHWLSSSLQGDCGILRGAEIDDVYSFSMFYQSLEMQLYVYTKNASLKG